MITPICLTARALEQNSRALAVSRSGSGGRLRFDQALDHEASVDQHVQEVAGGAVEGVERLLLPVGAVLARGNVAPIFLHRKKKPRGLPGARCKKSKR